jgi:hypothetical protein
LATLGNMKQSRNDPICVELPKVAKASTVLFYVSMPAAFLQKYFTQVYTELSIDFCKFCVHVNLT